MCMGKGDKCKAQKILDFLGGPVVKNLPCNAGNTGSISGQERFPHTAEQLSQCTTATEPKCCNY